METTRTPVNQFTLEPPRVLYTYIHNTAKNENYTDEKIFKVYEIK